MKGTGAVETGVTVSLRLVAEAELDRLEGSCNNQGRASIVLEVIAKLDKRVVRNGFKCKKCMRKNGVTKQFSNKITIQRSHKSRIQFRITVTSSDQHGKRL